MENTLYKFLNYVWSNVNIQLMPHKVYLVDKKETFNAIMDSHEKSIHKWTK